MADPKFYLNKSETGEWDPERPEQRSAYLKGLKPGRYIETIKKYNPKRSLPQNSYYWSAVIGTISKETGSDPDTVHAELKKMFLLIKDGLIPIVGSTRKLNTKDFGIYLDKVILWSAEFLGVVIPPPNYIDF